MERDRSPLKGNVENLDKDFSSSNAVTRSSPRRSRCSISRKDLEEEFPDSPVNEAPISQNTFPKILVVQPKRKPLEGSDVVKQKQLVK